MNEQNTSEVVAVDHEGKPVFSTKHGDQVPYARLSQPQEPKGGPNPGACDRAPGFFNSNEVIALRRRIANQRRELRRLNKQAEAIWHGWRRGNHTNDNQRLHLEVQALTQRLKSPPEVKYVDRYMGHSAGLYMALGMVVCGLVTYAFLEFFK